MCCGGPWPICCRPSWPPDATRRAFPRRLAPGSAARPRPEARMDVEALRPELAQVFAATHLRTYVDTDFALVSLPPAAYFELLSALAPLHDLRFQATVREPGEVTLIAPRDLWERI